MPWTATTVPAQEGKSELQNLPSIQCSQRKAPQFSFSHFPICKVGIKPPTSPENPGAVPWRGLHTPGVNDTVRDESILGYFRSSCSKMSVICEFCICDAAFPRSICGRDEIARTITATSAPNPRTGYWFLKREIEPRLLLFHRILFVLVLFLKLLWVI